MLHDNTKEKEIRFIFFTYAVLKSLFHTWLAAACPCSTILNFSLYMTSCCMPMFNKIKFQIYIISGW
jgi:hypothetical protein